MVAAYDTRWMHSMELGDWQPEKTIDLGTYDKCKTMIVGRKVTSSFWTHSELVQVSSLSPFSRHSFPSLSSTTFLAQQQHTTPTNFIFRGCTHKKTATNSPKFTSRAVLLASPSHGCADNTQLPRAGFDRHLHNIVNNAKPKTSLPQL